jgi:hypothetical protein
LKYYKDDGIECINSDEPEEVSLRVALDEVDNLPFSEGNFIGFIDENEATIQFTRYEPNGWLIDVPVIKEGEYAYSLQDEDLTTENVKSIIKKFFSGENWQTLCNLKKR